MSEVKYTAALAKGQGAIEDTIALLRVWEPGMEVSRFKKRVISEGILGKATAKRAKDLIEDVFVPRYLVDGGRAATSLKLLIDSNIKPNSLKQLLFLYTARANLVLHDFVREVYWTKYSTGFKQISNEDAANFLESAYNTGKLRNRWSEEMLKRIASGLTGCLGDFGMLESGRKSTREITPFYMETLTAPYLVHELHFSGYSDNAILDHPDWQLFGLERMDVLKELQRISNNYFIPQFSGEFLRISWMLNSMEEVLHVIARSGL